MPCFGPLTAYRSKEIGASGKRSLVFNPAASFSGVPISIPCGQCVGCRLERSRQWAVRCTHENMLHEESVFVTLTYDDDNLPFGGTLVKRDVSMFCKRLHNRLLRSRGVGIRYYGCGEYGEKTNRPHYHLCVFGYAPPDKEVYVPARDGRAALYSSRALSELWPQGLTVLGDVTFDSAAYCARYIMKKVLGPDAWQMYQRFDCSTGEIIDMEPEFTVMSRRPGIGLEWFNKYGKHAFQLDSVVINGREVRPPRYYDSKYELVDADHLELLKRKRRAKAIVLARPDKSSARRRVCETVAIATLKQKGRII